MREEKVLLSATLCFLVRDDEVLLAMKTEKIGKGCWNGYGGGVELGENPEEAAIRELNEEAKIAVESDCLEKVAKVEFRNKKTDGSEFTCNVHVYLVYQWIGSPKPTSTMVKPTWFFKGNLPFSEMMPADRQWLPIVLSGKKIVARFSYSPFQEQLLDDGVIEEVDVVP